MTSILASLGPIIGLVATGLGVIVTWWNKNLQVETLQQRLDGISKSYEEIETKIRAANSRGDYAAADDLLNQLRATHAAGSSVNNVK